MDHRRRAARRLAGPCPEYLEPEAPLVADPVIIAEFRRSYWDLRAKLAVLEATKSKHPPAVIAYFRTCVRLIEQDYGGYLVEDE